MNVKISLRNLRDNNRAVWGQASANFAQLVLAVLFLTATAASAAQATVLTFQVSGTGFRTTNAFLGALATYGDNVNSTVQTPPGQTYNYLEGNGFTPNIVVAYDRDAVGNLHFSHDDDGLWPTGVAYLQDFNSNPTDKFWITVTPDPGLGVSVNSFVLRGYNGNNFNASWQLRQDSLVGALLDSGTVSGTSLATVTPAANSYFGNLVLVFTDNANGNILGLVNLNFDQVAPVPEPSTLALLGLGVIGLAVRTRCRRSIFQSTPGAEQSSARLAR
jgi:hypothetical protein